MGEVRVAGFSLSTVITVPSEVLVRNRHSNKAFLSPWKGCDKEWDVVREQESKKET